MSGVRLWARAESGHSRNPRYPLRAPASTVVACPATAKSPRSALTARRETFEGPPLLLVELSSEDGGLDLLIYDEAGTVVGVSFVPAALVKPVGDVS